MLNDDNKIACGRKWNTTMTHREMYVAVCQYIIFFDLFIGMILYKNVGTIWNCFEETLNLFRFRYALFRSLRAPISALRNMQSLMVLIAISIDNIRPNRIG